MGRFTLPELSALETGVVVFLVVIMALVMFIGFEWARAAIYGKQK